MLSSKVPPASLAWASSRLPRRCRSSPSVPVAGMALILGIDRFMSECRALTNLVGNAVATIVVARWENELTRNSAAAGRPVAGRARSAGSDAAGSRVRQQTKEQPAVNRQLCSQ